MPTKLTPALLKALVPSCPWDRAKASAGPLNEAVALAGIEGDPQLAAFIAVLAHESDGMQALVEYADGRAYEGRKDLGNVHPGDGPRFKGRGFIQLTGRENYKMIGDAIGVDLISRPELLEEPRYAALSSGWFWKKNNLGKLVSGPVVEGFQYDRLNGAVNRGDPDKIALHMEERRARWIRCNNVLKAPSTFTRPIEAQDALARTGHYEGAVDGIVGPKTRAAVRAFQEDNGITPATGDIDDATFALMAPPEGYVNEGGNLKREKIEDSRIVKEGAAGRAGTIVVGAGAAAAPVATALLSASWQNALIFSALIVLGGAFVYACFGKMIKHRVEMWSKGIS